jgi:hypothetical protein
MATARKIRRIVINMESDGSVADIVEAWTTITMDSQGVTLDSKEKIYSEVYADLSAPQQTRVDDFVNDVNAFINNQEPIV